MNNPFKGIDVSVHNGTINWDKVKKAGIEFALIRAGYGSSTVDDKFKYNIENALKAGIKVGLYWFGYAYTVPQAVKEAEFFINLMKPYAGKIEFPVYYDWEYDSYNYAVKCGVKPDKQLVSAMTKAFLTKLEEAGYYAGNYTNIDYATKFFDDEVKSRYACWIAQWSSKCSYTNQYGIWQYGAEQNYIDSKYVDGISGIVDKDYCYIDYPTLIKSAGFNGFKKSENVKPVQPQEPESKYDVNGDGKVTAEDALEVLNHVVGNK